MTAGLGTPPAQGTAPFQLGKASWDLHRASGLAAAPHHPLCTHHWLSSDPQVELFVFLPCFPSPHECMDRSKFREALGFLYFSPGGAGEERTGGLCGFSNLSAANMHHPENPVPPSTLHKLPGTETHTPAFSLKDAELKKEELVMGASLCSNSSIVCGSWKCTHTQSVHSAASAFRIRIIPNVSTGISADIRKNNGERPQETLCILKILPLRT